MNKLQYICQQLFSETRGYEFGINGLVARDSTLHAHLHYLNPKGLTIERMKKIRVHGYVGVFDGNASSMVHRLLEFNFKHPDIVIDAVLDDWRYERQFSVTQFFAKDWVRLS